MNIIITGSAGFLGTNIVNALKKEHTVFRLDIAEKNPVFQCDLGDPEQVVDYGERVLLYHRPHEAIKIDLIIHMAAIGSITRCDANPDLAWESNILGFSNLIGLARLSHSKHVIYASSSQVYGGYTIDQNVSFLSPQPTSYYGWTKAVNESMAMAAEYAHKISFTGLRLFNIIGPYQKMNGGYGAIIPTVLDRIKNKKPIELYNHGENTRAFTPVSYVIDVVKWLMEQKEKPRIINVGNPRSTSVKDLIQMIRIFKDGIMLENVPAREWEKVFSICSMQYEISHLGMPTIKEGELLQAVRDAVLGSFDS